MYSVLLVVWFVAVLAAPSHLEDDLRKKTFLGVSIVYIGYRGCQIVFFPFFTEIYSKLTTWSRPIDTFFFIMNLLIVLAGIIMWKKENANAKWLIVVGGLLPILQSLEFLFQCFTTYWFWIRDFNLGMLTVLDSHEWYVLRHFGYFFANVAAATWYPLYSIRHVLTESSNDVAVRHDGVLPNKKVKTQVRK